MRYAVALALSFFCGLASADSWPAAKVAGAASPTGQVVVRVLPGTSLGDVYGFDGERKGESASAIFYRLGATDVYAQYQKISLLNPVAPLFTAVTDAGELVTLGNWHNMGLGKVVVIYRPDGQLLRSYDLAQIYTEAEIQKIPNTVSSVWWRCPMPPIFEPRISSLELQDIFGNIVEINLKTGALKKSASMQEGC